MALLTRTILTFLSVIALSCTSMAHASEAFWQDKQDSYNKCIANKIKTGDEISLNIREILTDCVQPESAPDLFVEAVSMMFPETSSRILLPNDEKSDPSVVSFIFRNALYKTSGWIQNETGFSPLDVYADPKNMFYDDTVISKYHNNGSSGLAAFGISIETGLMSIMRFLGYIAALLCLLIFIRRIAIAAYDGLGAKEIMVTSIKESPPIAIALYLTAPPIHGGMPVVGEALVAFLLFGALMSNVFSVYMAEVLFLFYGNGVVTVTANNMNLDVRNDIHYRFEEYVERTSDNIVAMNIIASNYLTKEIGENKSSNSLFRESLKEHPFPSECILRPYWEMKLFSDPRCVDLKSYANDKLSYDQLTWNRLHTEPASSMLGVYSKYKAEQLDSRQLYSETNTKTILNMAYERAKSKMAALCSSNPKLGSLSAYKGEWICNDFDYQKGAFKEGKYLAPDYFAYLSNMSGTYTAEQSQLASNQYYNSNINNQALEQITKDVTQTARIKAEWVIEDLQNNVDVKMFTVRGIITSLWNSISISNIVTKIAIKLQAEYYTHHENYFDYMQKLSPQIKADPRDWAIDEEFKDENNLSKTFGQFSNFKPNANNKSEAKWGSFNPDTIFKVLTGMSPIGCRTNAHMCADFTTNPISSVGAKVNIMITVGLTSTVLAHFIGDLFPSFSWGSGLFTFLAAITSTGAAALIAFTILPFFTYFFYASLKVLIRAIVYCIAAPIVLIQFILRKTNDEQYDENNIIIPKDILGMGVRLIVDFMAVSIALIGGLIMVYVNISILSFMLSYLSSAINIDDSISLLNLKSIMSYTVVLFLSLLAYVYAIYKAATLQPYIQEKVSEFAYTGFNLSTDKDNEAEVILGVLLPAFGVLQRR
ncbi:hypothetical protein [Vibrio sp. D431a]|uniref:hypothetical protein n=1 Tax=Vibrio sp. D431a TaxID=2837388 RepID=UPI002553D81D|nr:hypothetical protein [Vibrio sp. D431a]MDK9793864.1 hypothetical protein [Vibrio sp. D431a]